MDSSKRNLNCVLLYYYDKENIYGAIPIGTIELARIPRKHLLHIPSLSHEEDSELLGFGWTLSQDNDQIFINFCDRLRERSMGSFCICYEKLLRE